MFLASKSFVWHIIQQQIIHFLPASHASANHTFSFKTLYFRDALKDLNPR